MGTGGHQGPLYAESLRPAVPSRPALPLQRLIMIESQHPDAFEFLEDERSEELEQLHTAAERLLETAGTQKWSPRELQTQARNGHRREVVSLAFWQLVNDGELSLDGDLKVRRATRR